MNGATKPVSFQTNGSVMVPVEKTKDADHCVTFF